MYSINKKKVCAVKHDDATCGLENTRVALTVTLCKGLHHAVDLLSFSWQSKTPQELSVRGHGSVVNKGSISL